MVVGSPGKVISQTDENMQAFLLAGAAMYVQKASKMKTDLREI